MKKISLLSALAIVLCFSLYSCSNSDDSGSTIPTDNIPNIAKSKVPVAPVGGDPRGTYFGNLPYIYIIPVAGVINDSSYSMFTRFYLELKGGDANQGSYSCAFSALSYYIKMSLPQQYGEISRTISENVAYNPNTSFSGTWTVSNKTITFSGTMPVRGGEFTSDATGLFIYDQDNLDPDHGVYYAVQTLKRVSSLPQ